MAAGAYIFAPSGTHLTDEERQFFRDSDPWGFILFARNISSGDQVSALTSDLRGAVGRDAPILIDQEGGRVQRMRGPQWREWEPPLDQSQRDGTERAMYLRGRLIGAELSAVGIDCNCAPSADIATAETHAFIRNRCYGTDAETVIKLARANASGLLDAGVIPIIKHAPGHGRATLDSHHDLPRIEAPLDLLNQTDFAPFRALSDLPMAMTAHVVLTELDPELPVTLSPSANAYIREHLRLDMLMMTDDISMGALSGSVAERSVAALSAGCDLVLHCNGDLAEMTAVASAGRELDEAGIKRANAALAARRPPVAIDISEAEAELGDLLRESAYA